MYVAGRGLDLENNRNEIQEGSNKDKNAKREQELTIG